MDLKSNFKSVKMNVAFDLPDLAKERDNCVDFLQNFVGDYGDPVYRMQLVSLLAEAF